LFAICCLLFEKAFSTNNEQRIANSEFMLAGVEGFEPPTVGFGDRCSTNWNYTPAIHRQMTENGRCIIPIKALKTRAKQRAMFDVCCSHVRYAHFSLKAFGVSCFGFKRTSNSEQRTSLFKLKKGAEAPFSYASDKRCVISLRS
tara:strand:- start:950 stop:1381 length:432 start_codon:yes stop_codon:yes gene_type:complete